MLNLGVGEEVIVKSQEEILSTLDDKGCFENLPFMPEMLKYCDKRFKVYKRADKTCQYINSYGIRRMFDTVHLEGLRCDGEKHDDCEASCLLFWKEIWLKRIGNTFLADGTKKTTTDKGKIMEVCFSNNQFAIDKLIKNSRTMHDIEGRNSTRYTCQATEILKATAEMKWWEIGQYIRDIRSGNVCLKHFIKWMAIAIINWANERFIGWRVYPFIDKDLYQRKTTPSESLNLQAGEYVEIRSLKEILETLDENMKNRGLLFTKELAPYCGRTVRVLKRVKRIIDERTGEMLLFKNDCIILEGVICTGDIANRRLFCPRSMYPYWREIWLKRVET